MNRIQKDITKQIKSKQKYSVSDHWKSQLHHKMRSHADPNFLKAGHNVA